MTHPTYKWFHRSAGSGTDGEDRTTTWLRRGLLHYALALEDQDESE